MLKIEPKTQFEGEFVIPGDKSITHRAIMFNAVTTGKSVIANALLSDDTLSTCRCMQKLGAKIEIDFVKNLIQIEGREKLEDCQTLDCGNSGTTMRILSGLLVGHGVHARLYGDASLSQRPMQRVAQPLEALGANIQTTNGRAPLIVQPATLVGTDIHLSVASAQVKSAVLLAGLSASGQTSVCELSPTRNHTERMLSAMGANIQTKENEIIIEKSSLRAVDVHVPADISSAAYFMALGALKGKTLCKNVGINPTRTGILRAFDKLGIKYELQNISLSNGEQQADILVEKSDMHAIQITEDDVPSMIDELPIIALLCAHAKGESVITGAKELRVKESDRIMATAQMIRALGGDCKETEDGFIINGKERLLGGNIECFSDHRIAMTATIGLLASESGGWITGEECCDISFPNFFKELGLKS